MRPAPIIRIINKIVKLGRVVGEDGVFFVCPIEGGVAALAEGQPIVSVPRLLSFSDVESCSLVHNACFGFEPSTGREGHLINSFLRLGATRRHTGNGEQG